MISGNLGLLRSLLNLIRYVAFCFVTCLLRFTFFVFLPGGVIWLLKARYGPLSVVYDIVSTGLHIPFSSIPPLRIARATIPGF